MTSDAIIEEFCKAKEVKRSDLAPHVHDFLLSYEAKEESIVATINSEKIKTHVSNAVSKFPKAQRLQAENPNFLKPFSDYNINPDHIKEEVFKFCHGVQDAWMDTDPEFRQPLGEGIKIRRSNGTSSFSLATYKRNRSHSLMTGIASQRDVMVIDVSGLRFMALVNNEPELKDFFVAKTPFKTQTVNSSNEYYYAGLEEQHHAIDKGVRDCPARSAQLQKSEYGDFKSSPFYDSDKSKYYQSKYIEFASAIRQNDRRFNNNRANPEADYKPRLNNPPEKLGIVPEGYAVMMDPDNTLRSAKGFGVAQGISDVVIGLSAMSKADEMLTPEQQAFYHQYGQTKTAFGAFNAITDPSVATGLNMFSTRAGALHGTVSHFATPLTFVLGGIGIYSFDQNLSRMNATGSIRWRTGLQQGKNMGGGALSTYATGAIGGFYGAMAVDALVSAGDRWLIDSGQKDPRMATSTMTREMINLQFLTENVDFSA